MCTPILFIHVQQKLKTEEYRYVHDFISDIRLLLDNARMFYDSGSEEGECVEELERVFTQRLQEYAGRFGSPGEGEGEGEGEGVLVGVWEVSEE